MLRAGDHGRNKKDWIVLGDSLLPFVLASSIPLRQRDTLTETADNIQSKGRKEGQKEDRDVERDALGANRPVLMGRSEAQAVRWTQKC